MEPNHQILQIWSADRGKVMESEFGIAGIPWRCRWPPPCVARFSDRSYPAMGISSNSSGVRRPFDTLLKNCDRVASPDAEPLRIESDGVLDLRRDYAALRAWELIRSARSVVSVADICNATGDDSRVV